MTSAMPAASRPMTSLPLAEAPARVLPYALSLGPVVETGALVTIPPPGPADTIRSALAFARSFDASVSSLAKPYHVPIPGVAKLVDESFGYSVLAYAVTPVVGVAMMAAGLESYIAPVCVPLFLGIASVGPFGWVRDKIRRRRHKNAQATPLEAQSLRSAAMAGNATTPHARAIVAEMLATKLKDPAFVAAFDAQALQIVRELANEPSSDPFIARVCDIAKFLNRGTLTRGNELDHLNRLIETLPAGMADTVREMARDLVFARPAADAAA